MSFARSVSRSCDLAQAARSPGQAAARATRAADAAHANHNASESAAAAATAATATMATAATTASELHAAVRIFPIEEMERRESDVGHFLVAENEALIGRGSVRLRDIGTR